MYQDIRQSDRYGLFMQKIGWSVLKVKDIQIFIKKFPIIGSFIKIQRVNSISVEEVEKIVKDFGVYKIIIEPTKILKLPKSLKYLNSRSSYSPTKTIRINLRQSEESLFNNFTSEKRRAIRRAEKNRVKIKHSEDIQSFINLKLNKMGFLKLILGNSYKKQILALWQTFRPDSSILLLAYSNSYFQISPLTSKHTSHFPPSPLAGVLLLFHDKICYYWLAASTTKGNKLFAPSLLVWEALKLAKKKNCEIFDFEGIEDSRFKDTKSWSGFTKFKKGFGGEEIEFPSPIQKNFSPFARFLP